MPHPLYFSLHSNPNTNIWSFYIFLKVHPIIFNDASIISLLVPLVDNTYHLQLYQVHSIPKTTIILLRLQYLNYTKDKCLSNCKRWQKYYTNWIDIDIMKCLISKQDYCYLSGGLYPVSGSTDFTLALNFNKDNVIKSFCSITVNTITKDSITQLSPNLYLISVIQSSSIECRCTGYTDI